MTNFGGVLELQILKDLKDRDKRKYQLSRLAFLGQVDVHRLSDGQIARKIIESLPQKVRPSYLAATDAVALAQMTGNTTSGANYMLEADRNYNTVTFVRANRRDNADKASPSLVRELREMGHSPKPAFIKIASDSNGFIKLRPNDENFDAYKKLVATMKDAGYAEEDREGYLVDTRIKTHSGENNNGYRKRFVSDVDIAIIMSLDGPIASRCDQKTYSSVLRSNSWDINQQCSCTHGAFLHWFPRKAEDLAIKQKLISKHLQPEADPILGFVNGKFVETCIEKMLSDISNARGLP